MPDLGPLAGEPRERDYHQPAAARFGAWLVWWVLLMALWVILDDSLDTDELLAGAGAAAIAALVAELATYQAATRFRLRIGWLARALRLPGQVAGDTVTVYAALWRRLARGEQPDSAFMTEPVRSGDDTPAGVTRRVLLIGARSVAPNAFALGIDRDRDTMILHQLVTKGQPARPVLGRLRPPLRLAAPPGLPIPRRLPAGGRRLQLRDGRASACRRSRSPGFPSVHGRERHAQLAGQLLLAQPEPGPRSPAGHERTCRRSGACTWRS